MVVQPCSFALKPQKEGTSKSHIHLAEPLHEEVTEEEIREFFGKCRVAQRHFGLISWHFFQGPLS